MTTQLHSIAQNDTPASVEVPNSWPGLAVWALTKFGIGIVFAYGLWVVYGDLKSTNAQMMTILAQRAVTDAELARSMAGLTVAIEQITRESKTAHNGGKP